MQQHPINICVREGPGCVSQKENTNLQNKGIFISSSNNYSINIITFDVCLNRNKIFIQFPYLSHMIMIIWGYFST